MFPIAEFVEEGRTEKNYFFFKIKFSNNITSKKSMSIELKKLLFETKKNIKSSNSEATT